MSISTGNPIFQTVGGDGSTLSITPSGSTTPVFASDLAASVQTNTTDITAAKTNAVTALSTANTASTNASNALSVANAAIPAKTINQANGPVGFDGGYNVVVPGVVTIGTDTNTSYTYLRFRQSGVGNNFTNDFAFMGTGGTGNADGNMYMWGSKFSAWNDNSIALGDSGRRFSNLYLSTSPTVTSDQKEKTVIGSLGDNSYIDGVNLEKIFDSVDAKVFTYKNGSNNRLHVGYIAQDIQNSITTNGLKPEDYGLWCQDALYTTTESKDENGNTVYTSAEQKDENGNQIYRQSLRYDEMNTLMIAALKSKITDLTLRIETLETSINKQSS